MTSSDRNLDSVGRTPARRARRDPRRSRGLFRLHVALILVLAGAGSATATVRSESGIRRHAVALSRNLEGASMPEGLGPLSGPPSPPVSLDGRLKAIGYDLPEDANVYAVRIVEGPEGRIYEQYQAGGGALAVNFWPASSIKVLAAVGTLDFARSLGFTGAATVTFDDGSPGRTLRSIYEAAIRDSSNYDYDLLVRIAGLDRLNSQFLTARNGFPVTSISRSYSGMDIEDSPALTLTEGDRRASVPARKAELPPECPGNCSDLFEMTESVRRVVMNDQLPREQRFDLDPSDVKGLTGALLDSEGFLDGAVRSVLGSGARVYSKPGDADGLDCLDVTFVQSRTGRRFLLSATVPHRSGGCEALSRLAKGVLQLLAA